LGRPIYNSRLIISVDLVRRENGIKWAKLGRYGSNKGKYW